VRRLAGSEKRIEEVVDVFFGKEKEIPQAIQASITRLTASGVDSRTCSQDNVWRNKYVHFNFSNLKSLVFFLFLPKNSTKWILMLHHGYWRVVFLISW